MRALVAITRPANALMAAAGVAVGIMVARTGWSPAWAWAPLAAAIVTGFGNTLNDINDALLDATAHPTRPLPAGLLTLASAQRWAALLVVLGLVAAWLAGSWPALAYAVAVALLLVLYEGTLKRRGLPGNAAVALLSASTFPFGGLVAGNMQATWLVALMAFWVSLAREVEKDVEDMGADVASRRTLPMRWGARRARAAACVAGAAGVIASIPLAISWGGLPRLGLLAADVVVVTAVVAPARRARQGLKAAMALALAAFAARAL
ncbi:MAG: UbiA family prenyltransferase [Thermoplasmatota archaeon]